MYTCHPEFRLRAASFFFHSARDTQIIMRVPLSRASVPLPHFLDESIEKEKLRAVYPNPRSGPILAVLIHSPCLPECYFQSETKIEPDLRLSLSRVSHMGSRCQPKERDRSFSGPSTPWLNYELEPC